MSGIAGIYFVDGRTVDVSDLESMASSIAQWGPDGSGLWHSNPVGFVHRMLHTTPESLHERLPLVQSDGALAITADARIDNRDELTARLDIADRGREGISDSELILLAYQKWGEACPEQLIGDFVFAIWDGRARQLFCVRDPMGARPFYYYRSQTTFVFGTEIKALLCLSEVPHRLNENLFSQYLAVSLGTGAETLYQDVFRLPPGHCITANQFQFRIKPFWSLDPSRELRLRSDAEYAEAFREVFKQAVSCRLRSAFPIGSMLSGGLDSSSIACTARQLMASSTGSSLSTFSAVFPSLAERHAKTNERPYMDAVIALGSLDPHYVQADDLSPFLEFQWQGAEAIPAASAYVDWAIFKAAREHGVRVLLSGNDGDTVVYYGYELLAELLRAGRWKRLLEEADALAQQIGSHRNHLIWQIGVKPFVPPAAVRFWKTLRGRDTPLWDSRSLINPSFAARTHLPERMRRQQQSQRLARTVREGHANNLSATDGTYSTSWVLESLASLAAPFSLELRYPFFDRRLVEFCLSLPGDQKLRKGWDRWVMRRAMEGILPPEVQWRKGKGSNAPNFNRKLLEYGKATLDEVVLSDGQFIKDYVDLPALRAAYQRYQSDPMRSSDDAFGVFWVVVLALWLRQTGLAESRQ